MCRCDDEGYSGYYGYDITCYTHKGILCADLGGFQGECGATQVLSLGKKLPYLVMIASEYRNALLFFSP